MKNADFSYLPNEQARFMDSTLVHGLNYRLQTQSEKVKREG